MLTEEECNQSVYFDSLIIEEFKRLQPAGVFQGSAHEADSLIHHIVSMMNSCPFLIEGLDGMTYNLYHVEQDTVFCMMPSNFFAKIWETVMKPTFAALSIRSVNAKFIWNLLCC